MLEDSAINFIFLPCHFLACFFFFRIKAPRRSYGFNKPGINIAVKYIFQMLVILVFSANELT